MVEDSFATFVPREFAGWHDAWSILDLNSAEASEPQAVMLWTWLRDRARWFHGSGWRLTMPWCPIRPGGELLFVKLTSACASLSQVHERAMSHAVLTQQRTWLRDGARGVAEASTLVATSFENRQAVGPSEN
jgi:hypothetical protein